MIVKTKKMLLEIPTLQALVRRLLKNHPKRSLVEKDLAKRLAGFKGEQSMDYYLSFLPEEFLIFHGIRLQGQSHYFQMDILILSSSFITIFEVKHISGKVTFDEKSSQLIRDYNGEIEVFPDPVVQVNHQKFQFIKWLKEKKCPLTPIETGVIMTNPSSLIQFHSNNTNYIQTVIRSTNLLTKVGELKQKHKANLLNKKELRKISKLLLKHHTPNNPDILQKYNISKSEILSGVHCPECSHLPMERKRGKWSCPQCKFSSKNAHIETLEDYYLLFQPTVTNKKVKEFLKISSDSIVHKLLTEMKLRHSGTTKGRTYELQFDEWE